VVGGAIWLHHLELEKTISFQFFLIQCQIVFPSRHVYVAYIGRPQVNITGWDDELGQLGVLYV